MQEPKKKTLEALQKKERFKSHNGERFFFEDN